MVLKKYINEDFVYNTLNWAYERVLMSSPFPGVQNSVALAQEFLQHQGSLEHNVDALIKWQSAKSGAFGFATGLGGLATLPLTLPSNIAITLFIQIRLIAAIAVMGGYDLRDDRIRTLVYACICGKSTLDILKSLSVKLSRHVVMKINAELMIRINQAVGMQLVTMGTDATLISLGKAIPLVGGFVGGAFDVLSTNMVGVVAKKVFILEQ